MENVLLGDTGAVLLRQESLLRAFVKYVPAAVAMFDQQLRYLAASDA